MQISVDFPKCMEKEVLNSNSNLMSGVLLNSNLAAGVRQEKIQFSHRQVS